MVKRHRSHLDETPSWLHKEWEDMTDEEREEKKRMLLRALHEEKERRKTSCQMCSHCSGDFICSMCQPQLPACAVTLQSIDESENGMYLSNGTSIPQSLPRCMLHIHTNIVESGTLQTRMHICATPSRAEQN